MASSHPTGHPHHRASVPWNRIMRLAVILVLIAVAAPHIVPGVEHQLAWLCERLAPVAVMCLVAGLLAFILDPMVTWIATMSVGSWRIPRWVGIVVTYVGLTAVLCVAGGAVVPRITEQVKELHQKLPTIREAVATRFVQVAEWYGALPPQVKEQMEALQNTAQEKGGDALRTFFVALLGVLGWMAKGLIIIVLSIYFLIDKDFIQKSCLQLVPEAARQDTVSVVGDVLHVVRAYLRGQIVVIGFVAVAVTLVLVFIGMPYALTVGTVAGILEVIPYFGAFAGAVPAMLWSLITQPWTTTLFLFIFFIIINQFEGHVVIPLVMGHNLEMRPFVVLLSLLVGVELGGIVGLIVAVPVCRILQVFIEHGVRLYREYRVFKAASERGTHHGGATAPVEGAPEISPFFEALHEVSREAAAGEKEVRSGTGAESVTLPAAKSEAESAG